MQKPDLRNVRLLLGFFTVALIASGLSTVPLQWEVGLLNQWLGSGSFIQHHWPSMAGWIALVNNGVQHSYGQYPFLAYGTDWLAFGHVAIALSFLGAFRDPVRNKWIIEFGMLACALVIPWALVFGWLRSIPPFWTLVDMSFGILGVIPLWWARKIVLRSCREPRSVLA